MPCQIPNSIFQSSHDGLPKHTIQSIPLLPVSGTLLFLIEADGNFLPFNSCPA